MTTMKVSTVLNVRRSSQVLFFLLFVILLLRTEFRGTFPKSTLDTIRLHGTVEDFLKFDPLVGITTALSTHALFQGLLWSLLLVILTLVLGRFFCGWVCPLGSLHHFLSWWKTRIPKSQRLRRNRYSYWQSLKYYVLFMMLAAAAAGSVQTGLLDPLALLTRSLAVAVLPALNYGAGAVLNLLYASEVPALQSLADAGFAVLNQCLLSTTTALFHFSAVIALLFAAILIADRYVIRFWCRYLCPLGALLGVFARASIFGMEKNQAACTDCNLCLIHCQGADEPIGGVPWKAHECHLCLNCQGVCPEQALQFRFFPSRPSVAPLAPDLDRRRVLAGVGIGFSIIPVLRSSTAIDKNYEARLIRPPGAVEEHAFLERCIRCGACMKVCPTNAIQPTLLEAGLEGLWSPFLMMYVTAIGETRSPARQLLLE